MTIEEVVKKVLLDEHADVVREAVKAVAAEMMELEVSELIGAERGERRPEGRATHRNGYRPRRWDTRAGEVELQIPSGQLFPELSGAAPAVRAGAAGGGPARLCVRRFDAARRPARRVARTTHLAQRGQSRLRRARRARRGVPNPPAGGPLPVPVSGRRG